MTPAEQALERAERLLTARDVLAARVEFHTAESLAADADHCSGGRWLASMLAGDFESAWCEGDAIRARGAPDEHRFWQGEDIGGKNVIVRSLHGLGDAVQMLRFAPLLVARAASVTFEVPPRMVDLARCFKGVGNVVTWGDDVSPHPAWDVQAEVMELPYLLRLQCAQLPLATRYLHLPAQERARVRAAMGSAARPRVGLVWTCGDWNLTRCLPPELLQCLLADQTAEFWSLESEKHREAAAALGLRDAGALCGSGLLPLAATIAELDLVITVDTLAAHLAGALGKRVWLLLQHAADWRWLVDRSDSPWYPTMRIFRQEHPGDWQGVIQQVSAAIQSGLHQERERRT